MNQAMLDRYIASMVLSASGDALGYKNQEWEYCKSGKNKCGTKIYLCPRLDCDCNECENAFVNTSVAHQ